jgi:hypothetical protein
VLRVDGWMAAAALGEHSKCCVHLRTKSSYSACYSSCCAAACGPAAAAAAVCDHMSWAIMLDILTLERWWAGWL